MDKTTQVPTANLIFRVLFKIGTPPKDGEEDKRVDWCALTTFPAPDFQALIKTISDTIIGLLRGGISLLAGGTTAATQVITQKLTDFIADIAGGVNEGAGKSAKTLLDYILTLIPGAPPITNPSTINYIGMDGQVWTVPSLFPSVPVPGVTARERIKFIGCDGVGYGVDYIYFVGTESQEDLTGETLQVVDGNGDLWQTHVLGPSEYIGTLAQDINYLASDITGAYLDAGVITVLATNPAVLTQSSISFESVKACVDGTQQTVQILTAPEI